MHIIQIISSLSRPLTKLACIHHGSVPLSLNYLANSHVINYLKINFKLYTEPINLIDLGHAFFLIKFVNKDNMFHVLHDGPWFILGYFLTVHRWEPKFVASTAQLAYSAIWACLPELPTEYILPS